MTTITALPTPPSRSDPANFSTRADAFLGALPTFATETNAVASEVNAVQSNVSATAAAASDSASAAAASAVEAAASAATAQSVTSAGKWVSDTSYTEGQTVWSPINFQSYRRKTNGAGTTDPSLDETNWAVIGAVGTTPGFVLFSLGVY